MSECTNSLEVKHLSKQFKIGGLIFGTKLRAVDDVSFKISQDTPWILSIVGESGSGKSTLAKMVLQLLEPTGGEILINGQNVSQLAKSKKDFLRFVQPIFQNPFTAFSSHRTVDCYLMETAQNLANCEDKSSARRLVEETLQSVGLQLSQVEGKYPNQFSGGELQRISIARALIPRPQLIIADEPVSMVDASLRMNIVNLFKSLKDTYHVNFVYITHDLSTAYYVSDYIATLYRGKLIEFGEAKIVLQDPGHPYTRLLLDSVPKVGKKWDMDAVLPDVDQKEYALAGCKFSMRCPYAQKNCRDTVPELVSLGPKHSVLCHRCEELNQVK